MAGHWFSLADITEILLKVALSTINQTIWHGTVLILTSGLCVFQEGDRIGLMRKSNGQLHYYINGQDQGVASNETPQTIWGVVDLYGMAVKVTILDRNDPNYPNNVQNTVTRNNVFRHFHDLYDEEALEVTNVGMCYKHFEDLLLYKIVVLYSKCKTGL